MTLLTGSQLLEVIRAAGTNSLFSEAVWCEGVIDPLTANISDYSLLKCIIQMAKSAKRDMEATGAEMGFDEKTQNCKIYYHTRIPHDLMRGEVSNVIQDTSICFRLLCLVSRAVDNYV